MHVIYEPRGRAREYSPLACNLYMGCTHGCKYCFAPACMKKSPEEWHDSARARSENVLELFEKDCAKLAKDGRTDERVLFSFLSDPYQPLEGELHLTRRALEIAERYGIKCDVLTKGRYGLVCDDLPLMARTGTRLGVSLSFCNDSLREKWEPFASSVASRQMLLRKAHDLGIFTWVSVEPVIDPNEALGAIRSVFADVDLFKVGKLNHNKEIEETVDWPRFRADVIELLESHGCKYFIKDDLLKA